MQRVKTISLWFASIPITLIFLLMVVDTPFRAATFNNQFDFGSPYSLVSDVFDIVVLIVFFTAILLAVKTFLKVKSIKSYVAIFLILIIPAFFVMALNPEHSASSGNQHIRNGINNFLLEKCYREEGYINCQPSYIGSVFFIIYYSCFVYVAGFTSILPSRLGQVR